MFEDTKKSFTTVVLLEAVVAFVTVALIGCIIFLYLKIRKLEARINSQRGNNASGNTGDQISTFQINRPQVDNSTLNSVPDRFAPSVRSENPRENDPYPQPQRFRLPEPVKQEARPEPYNNPRPNNFNNQPLNYNRDNERFQRPAQRPFGDNFIADRENLNHQQKFDTRAQQPEYNSNNRQYY